MKVENYRGISMFNTIIKLFSGIINNRFYTWAEDNKLITENQAGFRKNYSTFDNLYTIFGLINLKIKEKRKKLYCFFVDLKAAFDTVNRQMLLFKLKNLHLSSKILKIIDALYTDTESVVWNGECLSEYFKTRRGLKQGCLMSPTLFGLYINDIAEEVRGGVRVGNKLINILLFADDIILISDNCITLQFMINNLEKYCNKWDLTVNLNKSKIIIFKKGGGKLKKSENWKYKNKTIEIVNQYKYLGIIMSPQLNLKNNFREKLKTSKQGINFIWNRIMSGNNVPYNAKMSVYKSVSRSVMCYAAQVWGWEEFEEIEKLKRFAIKKILKLPANTPNYMLYLETGENVVYIHTLKLHFDYVIKTLSMEEDRFPAIITREIIKSKTFWYRKWLELSQKFNININFENLKELGSQVQNILGNIIKVKKDKFIRSAKAASFHLLYKDILLRDDTYVTNKNDTHFMSTICKTRCELLNLNYQPWRKNFIFTCSLCNLNKDENLIHFLGECPVLVEIRYDSFGQSYLDRQECLEILTGNKWKELYRFVVNAWKYRQELVSEFNYN